MIASLVLAAILATPLKGIASYYSWWFQGRPTATQSPFDNNGSTCAMRTGHIPRYVIIKNLRNGRTTTCYVNDHGPYADVKHRIIDVSWHIKQRLQMRDLEAVAVYDLPKHFPIRKHLRRHTFSARTVPVRPHIRRFHPADVYKKEETEQTVLLDAPAFSW